MEFVKNFQEFISKQVDATVDLIFMNAHGYAMTTSGDITPEQQAKLDTIKKDLKQLVETQVIQNLDEKQRKFYEIPKEPTQEERELAVHKRHCSSNWCKYGEVDCPVVNGVVEKDGLPEVKYETPQPRIWNVPVLRTGFGSRTIDVIATTKEEAIEKAINAAGGYDYKENDAEYTAPDGAF